MQFQIDHDYDLEIKNLGATVAEIDIFAIEARLNDVIPTDSHAENIWKEGTYEDRELYEKTEFWVLLSLLMVILAAVFNRLYKAREKLKRTMAHRVEASRVASDGVRAEQDKAYMNL